MGNNKNKSFFCKPKLKGKWYSSEVFLRNSMLPFESEIKTNKFNKTLRYAKKKKERNH